MFRKKNVLSPAIPANIMLVGLVFCFAVTNFFGHQWPQSATIGYYSILTLWVGRLYQLNLRRPISPGLIDLLFAGFLLFVFLSLIFQSDMGKPARKYVQYLPFMAVLPYFCGRIMAECEMIRLNMLLRFSGLAIVPFVIADVLSQKTPTAGHARGIFFRQDHAALLLGMLFAVSMVAHIACLLSGSGQQKMNRLKLVGYLTALGIVTFMTVWVSARGALLAGLISVLLLCLTARWKPIVVRLGLVMYILGLLYGTMMFISSSKQQYYSRLLRASDVVSVGEKSQGHASGKPVLGENSCKPFQEGVDSKAMRLVLYQEALSLFLEHPLTGVGAANFGIYSCTGSFGFPHSTILQAFSEMGLTGGGLFVVFVGSAVVLMLRRTKTSNNSVERQAAWFGSALCVLFICADQFYGNYFMSVGTYMITGYAATLHSFTRKSGLSGDAI